MRKLWVIILFLAACQTSRANYADTLQPWIGQSEERLFQAWGLPQNVLYVTPNEKVLTYVQFSPQPENDDYRPYAGEVAYSAIAVPDFGLPGQPQYSAYYCQTTFTITGNTVTDFGFNGDDCAAD